MKVFEGIGKKTPVFLRFSTVAGQKGAQDTERDPRGNLLFIKASLLSSILKRETGT